MFHSGAERLPSARRLLLQRSLRPPKPSPMPARDGQELRMETTIQPVRLLLPQSRLVSGTAAPQASPMAMQKTKHEAARTVRKKSPATQSGSKTSTGLLCPASIQTTKCAASSSRSAERSVGAQAFAGIPWNALLIEACRAELPAQSRLQQTSPSTKWLFLLRA